VVKEAKCEFQENSKKITFSDPILMIFPPLPAAKPTHPDSSGAAAPKGRMSISLTAATPNSR
jgi:hypothetical protein